MQTITLSNQDFSLSRKPRLTHDIESVLILCNSANGSFTVKLPDCTMIESVKLIFKTIGAYAVTLSAMTGQTIDNTVDTTYSLAQYKVVHLVSDGISKWLVIAKIT